MKKGILILFAFALITMPMSAQAKDLTRYATKKLWLKDSASKNGNDVVEIKVATKLIVTNQGKTWSMVKYNDQDLFIESQYLHKDKAVNKWKGKSFKRKGRGKWNKCSWTWYTSRRKGSGTVKGIPKRHLDKKRGLILDKDGYVCLASGRSNKKKKKVVATPFGLYGKVYDTNGRNNNKWFDVYTNW